MVNLIKTMDDMKNDSKKEIKQEDQKHAGKNSNKKIEELEKRVDELENQLKRAVADYRNLDKRIGEEKQDFIKFANKDLLLKLFPAFDAFIIAEKYIKDEGLVLTIKKLTEVLKESGVEKIKTVGLEFDPNLMECVDTVEGEENKVLEEVRPGFTLFGSTLRAAHVKVGKKNEDMQDLTKEELQKGDYRVNS